ncbi:hypothetical protein XOC_1498 [Xanthomonas oryzae pv. oryzicola BLS256]|uniref:Transposase n=1 Tax=Xanthomonas oryzae pv. oryzicola (strain BLS256) TaxID=383407 RepID=G7TJ50_XANOB|nr:hypothetical protein XOC_1498 [Xanthomonas oryzae pv. oryzicola BLS256]QEO98428.1 hypothetical protein XOCgx_3439 [Xanthomonas oryzae pv. oryzicola]
MRPRNQRAVALIYEWLIAKQQFFAERAPWPVARWRSMRNFMSADKQSLAG